MNGPHLNIIGFVAFSTNHNIKRFIDAMSSKLGKNSVMVFVSFFDKWCIGVVHFELDTYGEIWFMTILNDEI